MDIKIEAQGHPNQTKLIEYYDKRLSKKYGQYPFIKTLKVKVDIENKTDTKVAINMAVEKGGKLYASHSDSNENRALEEVIRKTNVQLEKYKQKHYSHSTDK